MATGHVINVTLPTLPEGAAVDFTLTRAAVYHAGNMMQQAWSQLASGELVNRLTGAYVQGLRRPESFRYPLEGNAFAVGVFNVAKHAAVIEYGHGAFNLADRIRWGQTSKSRWSKRKRRWYIISPFRHYTPPRAGEGATVGRTKASMPRKLHDVARRMNYGERLSFDPRRTEGPTSPIMRRNRQIAVRGVGPGRPAPLLAHGAHAGRYVVPTRPDTRRGLDQPRARSVASFSAHLAHALRTPGAAAPATHHKAPIHEGLTKTGSRGHTQYMTWRVITQDSNWWIPAREGAYVAREVTRRHGPEVRDAISNAFRADVEHAIGRALSGDG